MIRFILSVSDEYGYDLKWWLCQTRCKVIKGGKVGGNQPSTWMSDTAVRERWVLPAAILGSVSWVDITNGVTSISLITWHHLTVIRMDSCYFKLSKQRWQEFKWEMKGFIAALWSQRKALFLTAVKAFPLLLWLNPGFAHLTSWLGQNTFCSLMIFIFWSLNFK